jgi:hypothetical protein
LEIAVKASFGQAQLCDDLGQRNLVVIAKSEFLKARVDDFFLPFLIQIRERFKRHLITPARLRLVSRDLIVAYIKIPPRLVAVKPICHCHKSLILSPLFSTAMIRDRNR